MTRCGNNSNVILLQRLIYSLDLRSTSTWLNFSLFLWNWPWWRN